MPKALRGEAPNGAFWCNLKGLYKFKTHTLHFAWSETNLLYGPTVTLNVIC